jgi:hypothetical protein
MAATFTAWYVVTLVAMVVDRVKGPRRVSTAAA